MPKTRRKPTSIGVKRSSRPQMTSAGALFIQPMPVFLGLLRTIVPASVNAIIGALLDVPPSLPLLIQIVWANFFESVLRRNIGIVFQ
jgi:hypothetical protein